MKSLLKYTFLIFGIVLFISSCEGYDSLVSDQIDQNPVPDSVSGDPGDADFSNYVAIGNSLTAGFMDAALYNLGQENSLAALIANQLEFAGAPETFNQPDINSESGFNTSVTQPPSGPVLGRFKLDTSIPGPSPVVTGETIQPFTGNASSLNNFGVPGIQVGQLLTPATGGPQSDPAFNPFYARFASAPGTSTILGDALATGPSFFTLWIGNNDVLGYAISGASNPAIFTSQSDFNTRFNAVISQLMGSTTADGVVINIPPILALPFFQAVPYNPIPLDDATAQQLNQAYANYNGGLQQAVGGGFITQAEADRRTISFTAGNNPYVMEDETLTDLSALGLPNLRQSEPTDLQTLSLGGILGEDLGNGPFGLQDPATDQYVLLPSEQQEIEQRRIAFNTIIQAAVDANSSRLALMDINTPPSAILDVFGLSDGQVGITVQGTTLQPDFSPNGVFSTDGIHPNIRGNAILANEIIRVIENSFGATIPKVDVLALPSVQVCAGDCASQQ